MVGGGARPAAPASRTSAAAPPARSDNLTPSRTGSRRDARAARFGHKRRRAVVHRPFGRRQIDARHGGGAASLPQGLCRSMCWTATICAAASTPISASRPRTGSRTSAASARWRRSSPMPASSASPPSSRPIAPIVRGRAPRRRRRGLPRDLCQRRSRHLRGARPQGPLPQGAQGRDRRVHRHLRPLRAAAGAVAGGGYGKRGDRGLHRADPGLCGAAFRAGRGQTLIIAGRAGRPVPPRPRRLEA